MSDSPVGNACVCCFDPDDYVFAAYYLLHDPMYLLREQLLHLGSFAVVLDNPIQFGETKYLFVGSVANSHVAIERQEVMHA